MKRLFTILPILFLLASCMEIRTTDPNESYKYWSGSNPSDNLKILNGQYWQSAHWTKEYILYLKLKPTEIWWNELLKQNQLIIDKGDWTKPNDSPNWFNPPNNSIIYKRKDDFDQGSRYLEDTLNNEFYIYEIQL